MKEVDVARPVVEELRRRGHDVYQEVGLGKSRNVADIVTDFKDELWIIESKVSLSWNLMAQAFSRKSWANKVSVAIPKRKWKYTTRKYVYRLFRQEGLGLIMVSHRLGMTEVVEAASNTNMKGGNRLRKCLNPAQKDLVEAGTAGGGHWTPYKETCAQLLKAVTKSPGMNARQAVDSIKHHYKSAQSARSTLLVRGKQGFIPGIEVRKSGKLLCFFLEGSK